MPPKAPCGLKAPKELSAITAAILIIVSIITTTGNTLVIIAVSKDPFKKLRTPFMYVLVNLAISDLLAGTVSLPTTIVSLILEVLEREDATLADVARLSYFISATASILNLTLLFLDRYFAVWSPVKYRKYSTFENCLLVSCITWVASISIPMIYLKIGYISYLAIFADTSVIIALVILVFTYFRIHKVLKRSTRRPSNRNSGAVTDVSSTARKDDNKRQKRERIVTRVFLTILALFTASYIPGIVIIYVLNYCLQCNCLLRHTLRDVQYILAVTNAAVNPFVCTIQLSPFRKALSSIFGRQLENANHEMRNNDNANPAMPSSDTASTSATDQNQKADPLLTEE